MRNSLNPLEILLPQSTPDRQSLTDCESDGDVYIMYSDIEEVLDSIDFEELKAVCKMFAIGVIMNHATNLSSLLRVSINLICHKDKSVYSVRLVHGLPVKGTNKEIREEGLINNLRDLIDDCEIVEKSRLQCQCCQELPRYLST